MTPKAPKAVRGRAARSCGEGPSTPATTALDRAALPYVRHAYAHDPAVTGYGVEAATMLRVSAARVFKTLLVDLGATPGRGAGRGPGMGVGIVPVTRQLDLKATAAALGVKAVSMADPAAAERATGYVLGGISPLGQKRILPAVLDESAYAFETIYVSGGRRGFDLELAPGDLGTLTRAIRARIARP